MECPITSDRLFRYDDDCLLEDAEHQIRLIKLVPGEGQNFTTTLYSFYRLEAPLFEALSYTWGPPTPQQVISLNDKLFPVRQNCYEALRSLCPPADFRWLWIDAVCINQDDNQEKSFQVQRMGDIYKSASTVIVYLGTDSDDSYYLTSFVKDFANTCLKVSAMIRPQTYLHENSDFELDYSDDSLWRAAHDQLEALSDTSLIRLTTAFASFAHRAYWSRLWVVQELLLGKGRLVFVCGRSTFQFHEVQCLFHAMERLDDGKKSRPRFGSDDIWDTFEGLVASSMGTTIYRIHYASDNSRIDLAGELFSLLRLECMDARDRIYGLLAVTDWLGEKLPIDVDYSKSALELAVEVVPLVIRENFFSCVLVLLELLDVGCAHSAAAKDFLRRRSEKYEPIRNCVSTSNAMDCCESSFRSPRHRLAWSEYEFCTVQRLANGDLSLNLTPRNAQLTNSSEFSLGYSLFSESNLQSNTNPCTIFRNNSTIGWSEHTVALVPWNVQVGDILVRVDTSRYECLGFRKSTTGVYQIVGVALVSYDYKMRNSRFCQLRKQWPATHSDAHVPILLEIYIDLDDIVAFELAGGGCAHSDPDMDGPPPYKRLENTFVSAPYSSYAIEKQPGVRLPNVASDVCARCGARSSLL